MQSNFQEKKKQCGKNKWQVRNMHPKNNITAQKKEMTRNMTINPGHQVNQKAQRTSGDTTKMS